MQGTKFGSFSVKQATWAVPGFRIIFYQTSIGKRGEHFLAPNFADYHARRCVLREHNFPAMAALAQQVKQVFC